MGLYGMNDYMDDYMGLYCLALWGFADSMDDYNENSEEDSRTNHFLMAWDKGYLIQTGLLTMGELQCVFVPFCDLCRSSAPSL